METFSGCRKSELVFHKVDTFFSVLPWNIFVAFGSIRAVAQISVSGIGCDGGGPVEMTWLGRWHFSLCITSTVYVLFWSQNISEQMKMLMSSSIISLFLFMSSIFPGFFTCYSSHSISSSHPHQFLIHAFLHPTDTPSFIPICCNIYYKKLFPLAGNGVLS